MRNQQKHWNPLNLYINAGAFAHSYAEYGTGSGRINMDNVECSGDEDALVNCTYSPDHDCDHSEDAGVECHGAGSEYNYFKFIIKILLIKQMLQVNVLMETLNLLVVVITQREE